MSQAQDWTLQPQECSGDYFFDGQMFMTRAIAESLTTAEISRLIQALKLRVIAMDGVDYLQVFTRTDGEKIYVIDNLSRSMLKSNEYTEDQKREYHYFTILFAQEY